MMALGGATEMVSRKASASAAASGSTNVKRENTARGGGRATTEIKAVS